MTEATAHGLGPQQKLGMKELLASKFGWPSASRMGPMGPMKMIICCDLAVN